MVRSKCCVSFPKQTVLNFSDFIYNSDIRVDVTFASNFDLARGVHVALSINVNDTLCGLNVWTFMSTFVDVIKV